MVESWPRSDETFTIRPYFSLPSADEDAAGLDDAEDVGLESLTVGVRRNRKRFGAVEQEHGRVVHEHVDLAQLVDGQPMGGLRWWPGSSRPSSRRWLAAKRRPGSVVRARPASSSRPAIDDTEASSEELPGRLEPKAPVRTRDDGHSHWRPSGVGAWGHDRIIVWFGTQLVLERVGAQAKLAA
jgi:hypothetical protein